MIKNLHEKTVTGFCEEWNKFDQSELDEYELEALFDRYFHIFPWEQIENNATGFDMGCGSGRWAKLVAPRVFKLHCLDPSSAIEVAKKNLAGLPNCVFHKSGVGENSISEGSMDFGYSLGVLHHVPDTQLALAECVQLLKPGAPFLVYLYYAMDNKPFWFRTLWRLSDFFRRIISRLPNSLRLIVCNFIAISVYWPLARSARMLETVCLSPQNIGKWPLSEYRHLSFYTMRTDALDRFGTQLEKRFSQVEVRNMMANAGLFNIKFSEDAPFWCAVGTKRGG